MVVVSTVHEGTFVAPKAVLILDGLCFLGWNFLGTFKLASAGPFAAFTIVIAADGFSL